MPRRGRHSKSWYKRPDKPKRKSTRRKAQRQIRTKRRLGAMKKLGRFMTALIGAGALVAGVVALTTGEDPDQPERASPGEKAQSDTIDTTLLFGTKEKAGDAKGALWLTLLSIEEVSGKSSVIYIPAHTATEVPGHGLLGVGEALSSGGVPLLLVTTENMLGVEVDRYLELSDADIKVLFDAAGPISVDVPSEVHKRISKNKTKLLFEEGPQLLESDYLRKLLYTVGEGGDETELGSRHLAFWDGLFDEFEDNPEALEAALREAAGAVSESDASTGTLARVFTDMAQVPSESRALTTLPVTQVSVGGDELYEADPSEIASFMKDTLGSKPRLGNEILVQILNGNGVPGIGEEVAEKLSRADFRVVLSGNAQRLDYEKTLVVTYDSSDDGLEIAEQARDLIGVGEVQVSGQGQGIVDLTIVVGKDFLRSE